MAFKLYCTVLMCILIACTSTFSNNEYQDFVKVEGQQFILNGKPYFFVGTNFWYGAYLGSPCEAGDRGRLINELDLLLETGITNLRVAATAEASGFKQSVKPVFLESPGGVNENLLIGLDFLLAEMGKRNMKVVLYLTNFWEWSGGMSAYLEWVEGKPVIDPITGRWTEFMNQSARFYSNERAQEIFRDYIRIVITRKNTITGKYYCDDPTIMSWQLANEPRPGADDDIGRGNIEPWQQWIDQTASFIKSLAPHQLVSTGNEGTMGSVGDPQAYKVAHSFSNIDYATFHMWPKNWGWYDALNPEKTYSETMEKVESYIKEHIQLGKDINKPLVLSEFGLERDHGHFSPESTVEYRDKYLKKIYRVIEHELENGSPLVGTNFWSWGGYGTAQHTDAFWQPGDPFTGDPPQEHQGLNSVFSTDKSTLEIIKIHQENLQRIGNLQE